MSPPGKWFTCTPLRFKGDHTFFARDSGLLCKGFQEIGVACKAIMPGPPMDDDQTEDLIRTDYRNLEDAAWWRSLGGEGVIFYGWGDGRYLSIVRAIKAAGLILITNLDTGGLFSMVNGFRAYTGSLWRGITGRRGINLNGLTYFAFRVAYSASLRLIRVDYPRAKHLREADVIGSVSPLAMERIQKVCRVYGGECLASKVRLIPHANASYMIDDPMVERERLLIAVGRWDDEKIKGTDLLLATVEMLVARDSDLVIEIYGTFAPKMTAWHQRLPLDGRNRVRFVGSVPNATLRLAMQRARISLCTSLGEGYHTVSAEALCSGCSVVGPDVPEVPSMKWFTAGPYGQIALRTAAGLTDAVVAELNAWDTGQRDPAGTSAHWGRLLHAPRVAERILGMVGELKDVRL